jgi:hypothetical protein
MADVRAVAVVMIKSVMDEMIRMNHAVFKFMDVTTSH